MKKLKLSLTIALYAVFCCAAAFASGCDREARYHRHDYTHQIAIPKYLKSEATHIESAIYYYSCACGDRTWETFRYGPPLGHEYVDGVCICGSVKPTEGLTYELNSEGTYSVTGLGDVTDTEIVIADIYGDYLIPVKEIAHEAFRDCTHLTSVVIPDGITDVGQESFYGCTGLTSITVPGSVKRIGYNSFGGCDNLTDITLPFVGRADSYYNSFFGYIFGASKYSENNSYVPASLKKVVLSEGIYEIEKYAFYGCSGLTEIKLPESLRRINQNSFQDCSGLTSVKLRKNFQRIDEYAFKNCISLTRIEIPKSVSDIGGYAFSGCSSLTIYCEAESRPYDWSPRWNDDYSSYLETRTVIWGYEIYDK